MNYVIDYDDIGILLINDICAIDIDKYLDDKNIIKGYVQEIVDAFHGSYIEISPSGRGLRILFKASNFAYSKEIYYINNSKLGLEIYLPNVTKRFVTLTGNVYQQGDIIDQSEALRYISDSCR